MKDIILYTANSCPACDRARHYLTEKGLDFKLIDITLDKNMKEFLINKTGAKSIPIIQFTRTFESKDVTEYIVGFSPKAIDRFIVNREE